MQITARGLETHTRMLTDTIGVRLAGSPQERRAAEYLAAEFRKYSSRVDILEYPVRERAVDAEKLEVEIDGVYREYPASLFSSAPSTGGEVREAELVWFDTATGYQRPDLSMLGGKAVVHLGCHIESEENYRRLMAADPEFILFTDTRYPGTIPLADGLFPAYVKKYGAVPSLNVAYMDVWQWAKRSAARARIRISGGVRESRTTVVVCEIPGSDPGAGVIYAGGHHDTQAGTVGADDNAIGSAAVVELARILAAAPHRRTLRLISFGAEEQLSWGSACYVRQFQREIRENGIFMCNFDTFGSAVGWAEHTLNTNAALEELITSVFHRNGIYFVRSAAPCPYTDQFPFAACGVPGIWIYRKNCAAGTFYHHRADNDAEVIDFRQSARQVCAAAQLLSELADREDISAFRGIPAALQQRIDEGFRTVYGGF